MLFKKQCGYTFNREHYLIAFHQFRWKGLDEVMASPIYLDVLTQQVYTPEDELSTTASFNSLLVNDPLLLETLIKLYPHTENVYELYDMYLDARYPIYSYH